MSAMSKQPRINRGDSVVVMGFGKSGISAVRFCLQQGAHVKVSDSGKMPPSESVEWLHSVGVDLEVGGHSADFFRGADLVLVSPGVPYQLPILNELREAEVTVCGELALAPYYLSTPVIAITGTNGKTTTTTLIGDIVRAGGKKVFVGGNIGTPLTDYLLGEQDADWVVLEVSSFQLDMAGSFRPDLGILLNITADHLDRYPSLEAYGLSKWSLFSYQRPGDVVIYNADDPTVEKLAPTTSTDLSGRGGCMLPFGRGVKGENSAWYDGNGVSCAFAGNNYTFDLSDTAFANFPNKENAAAAILCCLKAGFSVDSIMKGIKVFSPLAHRMVLVGEYSGVRYFNDSKATNVGAVEAALKAFDGPVILIAGGRNKGAEFSALQEPVAKKVKKLLLIGEARQQMAEQLSGVTSTELCDSLQAAVGRAREVAGPGDVVLFSPACASFDMFTSYVHRGEVFTQLVNDHARPND